MNNPKQTVASALSVASSVGRVSPSGRNPTNSVQVREDVGLRDETANPTYGAGWRTLSLGELGRVVTGKTPKTSEANNFGGTIPFVTPTDMDGRKFINSTARYLTEVGAATVKNSVVPSGTVMVSCIGSDMGKSIIAGHSCVSNQQINSIIVDSRFCSQFIYYNLSMRKAELQHLASGGSTMPILNKGDFSQIKIDLPSLSEQKIISGFLSALDDRIALLRETNATLEAIAQAMFKSWFVDFDPVHAKQQGRAPAGMSEATAALFPDSFEESELGLVPKGWKIEPLTAVFDFKEGPGIRNWQYTNSDQGTRFINIRCIQDGDLSIETANRITDEEANGKYAHFHLQAWDVVVSTSGTLGRSAIVRQEHLPLMLNTSVIRFQPIEEKMRFSFVYEYLNSMEFLFKLESMASGSVQKNFGPMHLKQIKLVCPPIDLLVHYESICRPLFEKVVANRAQIATLATLRDTLLPRLISGQLHLPQAEAMLA